MARIIVFGGTGFVGRNIVQAAARRGHEIVVASRTAVLDGFAKDAVTYTQASATDAEAVAELAADADAVVLALPAAPDDGLRAALPVVLQAVGDGARVGVVGDSGSLHLGGPDGPLVMDAADYPAESLPEARAQREALEMLHAYDGPADWFYLSPAARFGSMAPGTATGAYRTGDDVLIAAEDGTSTISGADFALAFVDELDDPAHHRARFTVGT